MLKPAGIKRNDAPVSRAARNRNHLRTITTGRAYYPASAGPCHAGKPSTHRSSDGVVQHLVDPLVMVQLNELGESDPLDLEHFVCFEGDRRGIK